MDTRTRAEKIAEICGQNAKRIREEIVPLITSQLDEAVREAHAGHKFSEACCDSCWLTGFAAAREKASDEADDHNGCIDPECMKRNCPVVIADRIRAMQPDATNNVSDGKEGM